MLTGALYLDALATAAGNVFSWPGILLPMAGTLLAMITSFLPGIGNAGLVVLLMVLTLDWEPVSVLLLFGALTGGATFMGSITAILFNIPGSVSSTASLLEGYPLGQRGLVKTAIACAATASAVGSVLGVLLLLLILPVIEPLLVQVGPLEKLLIGLWGLTSLVAVPSRSLLKSAVMALLGLLLAMPGVDPSYAEARWTLGSFEMAEGLSTIPVLLGLFTLAEIVEWMRRYQFQRGAARVRRADSVALGIRSVFRYRGLTLRSSMIGTLVGMVPGVGGTVASFAAYGHAAQSSTGAQRSFGRGSLKGLIAPEASVDAKDGGSLLPAVAFGLPGSEAGVILLTVFAIHGLVPGTPMLTTQLPLTLTLVVALLFSNILTSVVGVLLTPWLARLKGFPLEKIAFPGLLITLLSVLQVNGYLTDLYTTLVFGVAGYFWVRADWPRVPFVIAFVLGDLIETNLALSVELYRLDRLVPHERPTALFLFALIALTLWWMRHKPRLRTAAQGDSLSDAVLAAVLLVWLSAMAAMAVWDGGRAYSAYTWTVLGSTAGLTAWLGGRGVRTWRAGRHGLDASARPPVAVLPPAEHRWPLLALSVLPLAVWLLGPAWSLGVLAGLWSWRSSPGGWGRALWCAVLALAVAWGLGYVLTDLAQLWLPEPALVRGWFLWMKT